MKRHVCLLLAAAVISVHLFAPIEAAQSSRETGLISGWASADGKPVRNATAYLRDIQSGQLIATTPCDAAGIFAFLDILPGTYVVELFCPGGGVIAASAPVALKTGAMAVRDVAVEANAAAAKAAGAGACVGAVPVFELVRRPFRSPLGIVVVSAAAASGITGIVATRPDASASR